ncbi:hypothetical protein, partial [Agathobaculum butyriciproducens]|uniref:hypothetical protein n=1 Tax=Agathobaculum butyriciproducens TaxID=1628085 RepID=UPI003AB56B89
NLQNPQPAHLIAQAVYRTCADRYVYLFSQIKTSYSPLNLTTIEIQDYCNHSATMTERKI